MHLARLDTRHFEFLALGNTRGEALTAMQCAWYDHKRQTGATYTWGDICEDVEVIAIEPGVALRDGQPL